MLIYKFEIFVPKYNNTSVSWIDEWMNEWMNEVYFLLSYTTFISEKNGYMYIKTPMIKWTWSHTLVMSNVKLWTSRGSSLFATKVTGGWHRWQLLDNNDITNFDCKNIYEIMIMYMKITID